MVFRSHRLVRISDMNLRQLFWQLVCSRRCNILHVKLGFEAQEDICSCIILKYMGMSFL